MSLEGSIKDFGLADIIQLIRQQNKSGVLTVQMDKLWTKVSFSEGMIVSAVTAQTEGTDWIGLRLLRGEKINEDQLKQASKNAKGRQTMMAVLLEAGLLNQQELDRVLLLQTKETLFALFRMKEGTYRFDPGALHEGIVKVPPIDADSVLLEAVRQMDEWPLLEKAIPNQNSIFDKKYELMDKIKVAAQAEESVDFDFGPKDKEEKPDEEGLVLTPEEMAVLQLVDGRRNVRKLIDLGEVGEFHTYRALVNLTSMGVIFKKGEGGAVETVPEIDLPRPAVFQKARKFYLPVWDFVLIALFGAAVYIGYPYLQKSFLASMTAGDYLKSEYADLDLLRLDEAISIYYYKTGRLPKSTADLESVVTTTELLLKHFKNEKVILEKTDEGIRLKIVPGKNKS